MRSALRSLARYCTLRGDECVSAHADGHVPLMLHDAPRGALCDAMTHRVLTDAAVVAAALCRLRMRPLIRCWSVLCARIALGTARLWGCGAIRSSVQRGEMVARVASMSLCMCLDVI